MNQSYVVVAFLISVCVGALLIVGAFLHISRNLYFAKKQRRAAWGDRYRLVMLDARRSDESLLNFAKNPIGIVVRDEFSEIGIFRQPSGHAHHILQGEIAGRDAKIFDYQFVTRHGKSSTTHTFSVVCFYLHKSFPTFELSPHTFWDKVTALFGAKDVQIGDPEFDKHFRVVAENPGWLQAVMVSGLDDIALSEQQTSWHCLGDRLIVIYKGDATDAGLDALVHATLQFVQQAERY